MSRWVPGRAGWAALSLAVLCGCAATLHPVSVDEELARGNSPMARGGLSIEGYFDNHGLYHHTAGFLRHAGSRTLELRKETEHMRFETIRLSVDSVRTVMTRKT